MTELYYNNLIHPISLKALGPILNANLYPYLKIVYGILKGLERNKIRFRLKLFDKEMQAVLTRHVVKNQCLKENYDRYFSFFSILYEIDSNLTVNVNKLKKYQNFIQKKIGSIQTFQQMFDEFKNTVNTLLKTNTQANLLFYEIDLKDEDDFENQINEIMNSTHIEIDQSLSTKKNKSKEEQTVWIYDKIVDFSALLLSKTEYIWFAVPRNTYPFQTQRNALQNLLYYPSNHLRYFIRLFENPEKATLKWLNFFPKIISENNWKFLTDINYKNTQVQRDFVQKALRTPEFMFLEGPPGSGKTRAICELIYQAIKSNYRVMLIASTHVAVDNVLESIEREHNTGIIPIRIGLEKKIAPDLLKYSVENQIQTFCRIVKKHIDSIPNPSVIQKRMYNLIKSIEKEKEHPLYNELEEIVINSANLVCGTTIGILQYPPIKYMKITTNCNSVDNTQLFDFLIIDEASKTNFAEFLVPALYAKKWIIVGDPKQLTPYLDAKYFDDLLNYFDDFTGNLLILCSELSRYQERIGIIVTGNELEENRITEQAEFLQIEFSNLHELRQKISSNIQKNVKNSLIESVNSQIFANIYGSRLIFGQKEDLLFFENYFPSRVDYIYAKDKNIVYIFQELIKTQAFFEYSDKVLIKNKRKIFSKFERNWQEDLSWRLIRLYELDNNVFSDSMNIEEKNYRFNQNLKEIENLLPKFQVYDKQIEAQKEAEKQPKDDSSKYPINEKIRKTLDLLLTVWFPSILEVFLNPKKRCYFSSEQALNLDSELFKGLKDEYIKNRYLLLTYQNRMEPEICKYPSAIFYNFKALLPDPQLATRSKINIANFLSRTEFISINLQHKNQFEDLNINIDEILFIIKDLKIICEWTRINPANIVFKKEISFYEVAILTFYKNQEDLLNEAIRRKFSLNGKGDYTLEEANIRLIICTSDRFQGHEADIVLLSLTRTRKIGFLDSKHRINVALTRAKFYSRIYGDIKLIEKNKEVYPFLYYLIAKEKNFYQINNQLEDIRKGEGPFIKELENFIKKTYKQPLM